MSTLRLKLSLTAQRNAGLRERSSSEEVEPFKTNDRRLPPDEPFAKRFKPNDDRTELSAGNEDVEIVRKSSHEGSRLRTEDGMTFCAIGSDTMDETGRAQLSINVNNEEMAMPSSLNLSDASKSSSHACFCPPSHKACACLSRSESPSSNTPSVLLSVPDLSLRLRENSAIDPFHVENSTTIASSVDVMPSVPLPASSSLTVTSSTLCVSVSIASQSNTVPSHLSSSPVPISSASLSTSTISTATDSLHSTLSSVCAFSASSSSSNDSSTASISVSSLVGLPAPSTPQRHSFPSTSVVTPRQNTDSTGKLSSPFRWDTKILRKWKAFDLLHIDTAIVGRKHHPGKLLPLANTDNSSLRSNQLNSQRQSQMGSSLSAVDALISTDVSVNGVHKNVDESSAASLSSSSIPMPDPRAFNDSQAVPSASSQLRLERELNNPKDKYAIRVLNSRSESMGHIPARLVQFLSPLLDAGLISILADVRTVSQSPTTVSSSKMPSSSPSSLPIVLTIKKAAVEESVSLDAQMLYNFNRLLAFARRPTSSPTRLQITCKQCVTTSNDGVIASPSATCACRANNKTPNRLRPNPHRHVNNYLLAVSAVLSHSSHLFSAEEHEMLAKFKALPAESQRLYVRLMTRIRPARWFDISKLRYNEIENIENAVEGLCAIGWAVTSRPKASSTLLNGSTASSDGMSSKQHVDTNHSIEALPSSSLPNRSLESASLPLVGSGSLPSSSPVKHSAAVPSLPFPSPSPLKHPSGAESSTPMVPPSSAITSTPMPIPSHGDGATPMSIVTNVSTNGSAYKQAFNKLFRSSANSTLQSTAMTPHQTIGQEYTPLAAEGKMRPARSSLVRSLSLPPPSRKRNQSVATPSLPKKMRSDPIDLCQDDNYLATKSSSMEKNAPKVRRALSDDILLHSTEVSAVSSHSAQKDSHVVAKDAELNHASFHIKEIVPHLTHDQLRTFIDSLDSVAIRDYARKLQSTPSANGMGNNGGSIRQLRSGVVAYLSKQRTVTGQPLIESCSVIEKFHKAVGRWMQLTQPYLRILLRFHRLFFMQFNNSEVEGYKEDRGVGGTSAAVLQDLGRVKFFDYAAFHDRASGSSLSPLSKEENDSVSNSKKDPKTELTAPHSTEAKKFLSELYCFPLFPSRASLLDYEDALSLLAQMEEAVPDILFSQAFSSATMQSGPVSGKKGSAASVFSRLLGPTDSAIFSPTADRPGANGSHSAMSNGGAPNAFRIDVQKAVNCLHVALIHLERRHPSSHTNTNVPSPTLPDINRNGTHMNSSMAIAASDTMPKDSPNSSVCATLTPPLGSSSIGSEPNLLGATSVPTTVLADLLKATSATPLYAMECVSSCCRKQGIDERAGISFGSSDTSNGVSLETAFPCFKTLAVDHYLSRFCAGYVYTTIGHYAINVLERHKRHRQAIDLALRLLQLPYCLHRRGYWWTRLCLNLETHLLEREWALHMCCLALQDPFVRCGELMGLQTRVLRLHSRVSKELAISEKAQLKENATNGRKKSHHNTSTKKRHSDTNLTRKQKSDNKVFVVVDDDLDAAFALDIEEWQTDKRQKGANGVLVPEKDDTSTLVSTAVKDISSGNCESLSTKTQTPPDLLRSFPLTPTSYEWHQLPQTIKHIVIRGRPTNKTTGQRSHFFGYDNQMCSVEELVLQHYARIPTTADMQDNTAINGANRHMLSYSQVDEEGGWEGVHCENSVWHTLFGLLFWDILFADVREVFHSKFQDAPLDLDTDGFWEARRHLIEVRLAEIRASATPATFSLSCTCDEDWQFVERNNDVSLSAIHTVSSVKDSVSTQSNGLETDHSQSFKNAGQVEGMINDPTKSVTKDTESNGSASKRSCCCCKHTSRPPFHFLVHMENIYLENQGTLCRGVNWDAFPLAHLKMLAACIGGWGLAGICESLAKDHKNWSGGMPDLLLWKPAQTSETTTTVSSSSSLPFPSVDADLSDTDTEENANTPSTSHELCRKCNVTCQLSGEFSAHCSRLSCSLHRNFYFSHFFAKSSTSLLSSHSHSSLKGVYGYSRWGWAKLVEVKGPRDRLSDQQKAWLARFAYINKEIHALMPPISDRATTTPVPLHTSSVSDMVVDLTETPISSAPIIEVFDEDVPMAVAEHPRKPNLSKKNNHKTNSKRTKASMKKKEEGKNKPKPPVGLICSRPNCPCLAVEVCHVKEDYEDENTF